MFENLSERLERSFKILKGEGKITEINVAETLKDVRRALLDADVNYKVAKTFTDTVKKKAMGQNVINALKPKELMVKIVHDELTEMMGGTEAPLNLDGNPAVILMSGLQGAGKTTFAGKLARKLKSAKGKRPLLVGADVYRPAAREQLRVLAASIGVPVYTEEDSKDPVQIALNAIAHAKSNHLDLVIVILSVTGAYIQLQPSLIPHINYEQFHILFTYRIHIRQEYPTENRKNSEALRRREGNARIWRSVCREKRTHKGDNRFPYPRGD